jgi:hypothetical protein
MTEPTLPRGSEPEQPATRGEETHAFAAPVPPQQPLRAEVPPAQAPAPRRRGGKVLMGAAAAGLLAVGVAVGVVVGQATAGSAAADTGSSTSVTDDTGRSGTPPDGGWMPGGGHGGFDPDGDDGTADSGNPTT